MKTRAKTGKRINFQQSGFTLLEMLLATVIILVGLVAVAQLVPTSVLMNSNHRNDATALVFAQHILEGMHSQPIANTSYTDPQGVLCPAGDTCQLGDPSQPSTLVGNPVIATTGAPIIDFSATPVAGYSFNYIDPNDPLGASYDVRWAVITRTNGTLITSKRIILGVFRRGMSSPTLPVTLDTLVSK